MMQESVYCKLVLNQTVSNLLKAKVRENSPSEGIVQMLSITEKQYQAIDYLVGESNSEIIDNDKGVLSL